MGQSIAQTIETADDLELLALWRRGEPLDDLLAAADVVIDFSLPEGTADVLAAVQRVDKPLVCGVSGLNEQQMRALTETAAAIPLVYDRNMSLGVAVLTRSVAEAAAALGPDVAVHIEETHHVHKKDAPSGTALKLGEAIAAARGQDGTGNATFESERRGEVPGDHQVTMSSATEQLVFGHSVTTRDVFAAGAVRAARWVVRQKPGLYDMQDVLFSKIR